MDALMLAGFIGLMKTVENFANCNVGQQNYYLKRDAT